jgi:Rod binding domain-containing protein
MKISSVSQSNPLNVISPATANKPASGATANPKLRQAFDSFVGETFYGQMLKSLRSTQSKTPYFNGGHAEEVFTQQLDQVLSQKLSKAGADKFSGPMYNLFTLRRQ